MRYLSSIVMMLIGGAIMLGGIVMALRHLGGLYEGVLEDPMGQPEGTEDAASFAMLRWVGLGAFGVVPFLMGVVMFRRAMIIGRRRKQRLNAGQ